MPKMKHAWYWLLWWKTDAEEIQRQVAGYNDLKVYQSSRGISALLLWFSAVMTLVAMFVKWMQPTAILDAAVFAVLGAFVFKGKRWAMMAAMIVWTFEKLVMIAGANFFIQLIWWAVFMHAFFMAYKVETAIMRNEATQAQ